MGQTLTHGIYLPDEGERNCYSGLAANWGILDGAVGTIAAHTAALAGKAPLVHTHTKSDITDFPAYGNAAGTICEGNDSRLSDARTPVAHTHTKSDVTDLFNSANTWTASNTYNAKNALIIQNNYVSRGSEPSSYQEQQLKWNDTDGNEIARIRYLNQLTSAGNVANGLEFSTTDKFKDGVRDPTGSIISATFRIGLWNDGTKYVYNECRWRSNLLPFGNNTNDVGSSSYQWNNLYAKNYYYNGTAWGLDKANTWTGSNQFNASVKFSGQTGINWARGGAVGTLPSSVLYYGFQNALDSNDNVFDRIRSYVSTTGTNLQEHIKYAWNDLTKYATINYWINADGSDSEYKLSVKRVIPGNSNETDLGNSTHKWKTLNGVNPGALSSIDSSASIDMDTTNWAYGGSWKTLNTASAMGWGYIILFNCGATDFISIRYGGIDVNYPCINFHAQLDTNSKYYLCALFQVVKNQDCRIKILSSGTLLHALFYPCLGNV